jgi:hypothetical protein
MIYEETCLQNQYLYGLLEQLTTQISFCKQNDHAEDVIHLQKRKDTIKELIYINLDQLEEIWHAQTLTMRTSSLTLVQDEPASVNPSELESAVIGLYRTADNKSMLYLAEMFNITTSKASEIITRYLTHKFNLVKP